MVNSVVTPSSRNSCSEVKVVSLIDEIIPVTKKTVKMYKLIANIPVISFFFPFKQASGCDILLRLHMKSTFNLVKMEFLSQ